MSVFRLACSASMLAFAIAAQPAFAQDADEDASIGGLNEIIVTAQRREESVQDVPIAISAFNEAELETRGISSALEVTQFVPNLVGLNNTGLGTANSYFLRGLGNTETVATFDPPIGTYVDDIYLSRQNANNLSFFDVERVEVLRGPQGTLFGRNTTGGAVNVFLAEPEFRVGGYVEAGYGSYDRKLVRASVDLPLADTFAIKVSGYWQDDDGYAKNTVTGERANESDGWGARLGLLGELSDNARWVASYMRTESQAGNILNFDCDPANPSDCDGRFVTTGLRRDSNFNATVFGPAGLATGPLLTGDKNEFGLGNDVTMDFVSSNLELGVTDAVSVNIITGFVHIEQDYALDFADGRALPSTALPVPPVIGYTFGGFTIANEGSHTQFTQEVKVNAELGDGLIDLVGGVFYFHEFNETDFGDVFSLGGILPAPAGYPLLLADRRLKNTTDAWAGYLQGDLNLTDALTLTAGIRYTDETKTFDITDNRSRLGGGLCIGPGQFGPSTCLDTENLVASNGVAIPNEQTTKIWTPRFAVNYELADDFLVFASATRGFKSGGWNARGTAPGELLPFGPEKAWSYEVGAKTQFWDNRVRLNVTGFWLDVAGLQTPAAFIRPNGSIAFITRNFADYRNKGVEVELTTVPFEGLNLFAGIGYQDDEYRFDSDTPEFDAFGVQSVPAQQAACLAQLGAGLLPNIAGADGAPSCGVGIVAPDGSIAEPVRTPEWTVSLGASYDAQLGGGLSLIPAVNANWRAESEVGTSELTLFDGDVTGLSGAVYPANTQGIGNFVNPISGSFSDDRWILNASLTLRAEAGWSLIAECKNCLDEESVESALANYSYLNPPRTWQVRAKFDF